MSLSFVQLNVEANAHPDGLRRVFENNPDVICFQEVFLTELQKFATEFGYYYTFSPHVILDIPGGKYDPLGEWGIAILSKEPQYDSTRDYYSLTVSDVKSQQSPGFVQPRSLITSKIKINNTEYIFGTTHFTWAMPEQADKVQEADLNKLIELLSNHPSIILSGDFNAPVGSLVQKTLARKYRYHLPAYLKSTLDPDLFRVKGIELVVDHLYSTPDYLVTDVQVKNGYSDHCAIFANIDKITT